MQKRSDARENFALRSVFAHWKRFKNLVHRETPPGGLSLSLLFTALTAFCQVSTANPTPVPGPDDPIRVIIRSPDGPALPGGKTAFHGEVHIATTPEQVKNLQDSVKGLQTEIESNPNAYVSFGIHESPETINALSVLGQLPEFKAGVRKFQSGWALAKSKLHDFKIRLAGAKLYQLGAVLTAKQAAAARAELGDQGAYERLSLREIKERFGKLQDNPEDSPEDRKKGLYVSDRTGGLIHVQKPGVLATFSFFKLVMGPTSVYMTLLAQGKDPVLILPLALLSAGWQAFVNSEYGRTFMQKMSEDGIFAEWARKELDRLRNPLLPLDQDKATWANRTWSFLKALTPLDIRYTLSWSYLKFLEQIAEKGHLDRAAKFFFVNGIYNFVDAGLRHVLIGYPFPDGAMTSLEQGVYMIQRAITQSAADASGSVIWSTSFNRIIEAAQDDFKDAQMTGDSKKIDTARKNLERVWSQQRIFRNNLGSIGSFLSTLARNNMGAANITVIAFNAVGMLYGHAVNKVINSDSPERFRTFTGYLRALTSSDTKTCSRIARPADPLQETFRASP